MNILLLGSGGREHALAWKLAQSPSLTTLYAAPGNPGIAQHATLVDLDATDHRAVVDFCLRHAIGLVVIGPEAPLVDGLADNLRVKGYPVFGPGKKAAQLEGSKGFTKDLCKRAHIPTAAYERTHSKDGAIAALGDFGLPVVIKADGLAAGKGVIIAETRNQAVEAIEDMFSGAFGAAGAEVVLEEFMTGEEASFFALTDGSAILPFGSAQDHKRVGDGDTGPNTGGMGAYSPARVLTPELEAEVIEKIIRPTVETLAAEGTPYSGVLYAGLMLTDEGPKLIEYNARFGDPECQVLMMRFDGDLVELLLAVAQERLAEQGPVTLADRTALTVVMAANGYPGTPEKGGTIGGIDAAEASGARVFHAGTADKDGVLVANGGRVLNVTASGSSVGEAQAAAYRAVDAIEFPTGFCRRDIGWREVEREGR
ncbi:phosphoribosylamine--glycine ligase [Sphingobium sp. Cam5-1]|uniref:phosphoribosylamine--glycine ligase n=1 Tax=Sphingobium sp. Cam5-1 TaxID=2789327 RepID=UPI0018AD167F|nr:phosphoribosylamine--glycine ligase [Sphingobium sp. Cam5-1]QPI72722.1 phosphoribosylamine--glycine ligase [Sphingobium sp. Cam5-1]